MMRRQDGMLLGGAALLALALTWTGGRQAVRAQAVTTETLTLSLDSVLVGGARPPAPIGHEGFAVTLTPAEGANAILLRATDTDDFTYEATYTSRGPN